MYVFIILLGYFLVMMVTTSFMKKSKTLEDFVVGDRKFNTVKMALSISASWIWAPALFVSAENAYNLGLWGFFWFFVPNIITLLLFIPFAKKIKSLVPNGVSIVDYIEKKYGDKNAKLYKFTLKSVAYLSTSVQLLAGASLMVSIVGGGAWAFFGFTIMLSLIVFLYSFRSGFRASVMTDVIQMCVMIVVSLFLVFLLRGRSFNFEGIQSDTSFITVTLTFGISSAIGLISGILGDQTYWQRAYATKDIAKSFTLGAVFFAIIPLSMGMIGFAGSFYYTGSFDIVSIMNVLYTSNYVMPIYFLMVISGLLSTVDSNVSAITSLELKGSIKKARKEMLLLLAVGIAIANIPNISISDLFLFYGALRSSLLLTTIASTTSIKLDNRGVFAGILIALVVGIPMFFMGQRMDLWELRLVANILILLLPITFAYTYTKITNKMRGEKK